VSISDLTPNATTIAAIEELEANRDIVKRLRDHVNNRGGPSIQNGAWEMMLEAADEIERFREALRLTRRAMKEECDFITDELAAPYSRTT
jgi:hypothetical protein